MPIYSTPKIFWSHLKRLPKSFWSPAERYRNAPLLHGMRVALAFLTSIALTSGINIPHGVWASVSLLVVIGGLQHHGNIRKKATERALGTMFGAVLGLAWVAQYAVIGSLPVTYILLSVSAGVCAYYAVGRGGYIALLTAITMSIVAGHGDDSIEIGLWRTANVLIGIAIALLFSFALPLHATYSWRDQFSRNMRSVAAMLKRLTADASMTPQQQIASFSVLSQRLVSLRNLMASVSQETNIPLPALETIQRQHRAFLSALEMFVSAADPAGEQDAHDAGLNAAFHIRVNEIRKACLDIARALRSGKTDGLRHAAEQEKGATTTDLWLPASIAELQSSHWVVRQMVSQTEKLKQMLGDPNNRKLFSYK